MATKAEKWIRTWAEIWGFMELNIQIHAAAYTLTHKHHPSNTHTHTSSFHFILSDRISWSAVLEIH